MPRPTAIDQARKFRDQLARREADSVERMARIYQRIQAGLQNDIVRLAGEIALMDTPTRGQIMRLTQMQAIQSQVKEQVSRFGGTVQDEVSVISSQAVEAGIQDALKLMEVSLQDLPDDIRKAITGSFARLPSDAVEAAAGLTGPDSPFNQRYADLYGEWVAEQVGNHITDGIAKGQNPKQIARLLDRNLTAGLGQGLTSAISTVRTAQIKSYQTANHATYRANGDIVQGWVWWAFLGDGKACLSCIAMHGQVFPLDEDLADHDRGRCAPIPQTISYRDLGLDIDEDIPEVETGEQWFNRQPESVQKELMGPGKFQAWQDGQFEFGQLSRTYDSAIYGELRREATLEELTGRVAHRPDEVK